VCSFLHFCLPQKRTARWSLTLRTRTVAIPALDRPDALALMRAAARSYPNASDCCWQIGRDSGGRGGVGASSAFSANWVTEFGSALHQLGGNRRGGLSGLLLGIVFGGLICDRLGYESSSPRLCLACVTRSVTFTASAAVAFASLYWGMFILPTPMATRRCRGESSRRTLFPSDRHHYLNILHASWPAGLAFGARLVVLLGYRLP